MKQGTNWENQKLQKLSNNGNCNQLIQHFSKSNPFLPHRLVDSWAIGQAGDLTISLLAYESKLRHQKPTAESTFRRVELTIALQGVGNCLGNFFLFGGIFFPRAPAKGSSSNRSRCNTPADLHLHTLTSADLHLHTLTPADLHLHILAPADLHLHTFTPADLHLHTLTSADLHLHTLTPADLHLHTLTSANLHLHTFKSADLHLHTLTSADLHLHTFTSADLLSLFFLSLS